jgi:hypothetical protein
MKPLKTAGVVALVLCALAAAYYSYTQTLGSTYVPPSASGGPPAGMRMPAMGGPPKPASNTRGAPPSAAKESSSAKPAPSGK